MTDWQNRNTSYTFDAAGRLAQTLNPNGTSAALTYDNADRLTGLTNVRAAQMIATYAYTLDSLGNHSQATVNEPLPPSIAAATVNYSYDNENRLTSAGGVSFTYDADGNLTAKGPDSFVYDFEDRLKQSTIGSVATSYQYDGAGNRLARTVAGLTTRYVLDLNGSMSKVLMETDSANSPTAYYLHGLGLVARIKPDSTASYYHYDSRGSAVALTDQTGNMTDAYAYDPFGKPAGSQGATVNPFKYVGRYGVMDEGNGLVYIRARYYDPDSGRFITKDPNTGQENDSQSLHRYIYATNNPIRLLDISGFSPLEAASRTLQNGTSDASHAGLVEHKRLSAKSLRIIQQSQAESLQYELESIKWNMWADIGQGLYDALQTTEALLTGNVVGVGTGLSRQLSTLAKLTGHDDVGQSIDIAANIVDLGGAIYDFGKMVRNIKTLVPAIRETGLNLNNIQRLNALDPIAQMYLSILEPTIKEGFGKNGWGGMIGEALFRQ